MNINELKKTWQLHKDDSEHHEISEEEIVFLISHDLESGMKIRKLLYNTSSFFFLLLVCQTC